ncbi:MAG: alpha/beta hydrolase, partial [Acidimicrobiia bacterium]
VTYPDRVESLTLYGTTPVFVPPEASEERIRRWEQRRDELIRTWGTEDSSIVRDYAPSLASDPEFRSWHQWYERNSATSDAMRDLFDLLREMDVRDVLDQVAVPTLVIHRTDDPIIPVAVGREMAAAIPDARWFEQPGIDHFGYAGEVDGWMDEMERFITGEVTSPPVVSLRPHVRIVTLGRFGVVRDGIEIDAAEWGSRLARQLCKRLVVARGWPVTRDELMDLLWPGETDRAVLSARLSVQLSTVRRILGGGVVATRESVSLDLKEVSTDLEALFDASDDEAVVDAFTGEFLPEDVYEDWSGPMRDAARSRFATACRRLAESVLDENPDRAVALAQRLVDLDRYDDSAHRLLVGALLSTDDAGPARTAHARWAEAMAELDLEVPPLEDLKVS